jgi:hypothetical protein
MENNFGQILLQLVRKNKDNFLGLLRRNGVLVNTNVSNEVLTNTILKAMQKSESFKKEAILLMGVLMAESNDGAFANFNTSSPFGNLPTFDPNVFSPKNTTTTTTTADKPKKDFADTTVGNVLDKLFTIGNKYLESKELDVRKVEAETGGKISDNKVLLEEKEKAKDEDKGNVGLYIGLGIGGLALVGVLVYVIAKKK